MGILPASVDAAHLDAYCMRSANITFAVRLPFSSIKDLPSILRALAANATALKAKRRALAAVIPRLLWRVATPSPAREAFANTEDAFSSVMATLAMRRAHGLRGEQ